MNKIIFVFLMVLFGIYSEAKVQFPAPSTNACSFYPDLETELRCDKKVPNYLSGYGFKYCNEFRNQKRSWKINLQTWVEKTTYCLQEKLTKEDEKSLYPCEKIQDVAFDYHPRCYRDSGFCDFEVEDKSRIVKVVSIADIRSNTGITFLQGWSVALKCDLGISQGAQIIVSYVIDLVRTAAKAKLEEVRRHAIGLIEYIFSEPKTIDQRANQVIAEIIGFEGAQQSATASAHLGNFYSLEEAGEKCDSKNFSDSQPCKQLAARYGKGWSQASRERKQEIARKGLERAYFKYARQMK